MRTAFLLIVLFVALVPGCFGASHSLINTPEVVPPAAPAMPKGEFAIVGWLAAVSLTIGVVTAILSFWLPLVPIKGSIACVLLSVGLFALKYALDKWLHIAVNIGIVIGAVASAVALFPLLHTWINAHIAGIAKKIAPFNPHAANVLREVSDGGTGLLGRVAGISQPSGVSP